MPEAYKELLENCEILEQHYKDMMVNLTSNRTLCFSTICYQNITDQASYCLFFFFFFFWNFFKDRILNLLFKKIGCGCCNVGQGSVRVKVQ